MVVARAMPYTASAMLFVRMGKIDGMEFFIIVSPLFLIELITEVKAISEECRVALIGAQPKFAIGNRNA
jgi:hypothetical protein